MIIKKYENSKLMKIENGVFPFLTNSLINAQLKFIAKNCGITKRITFHLARHTFATTITLTNGVPIETVSKMLGHTSIKTTQIYAKVVDSKISNDMLMLREKLGNKQENPVQIRAVN
jgi:site-specific recombinase XerD